MNFCDFIHTGEMVNFSSKGQGGKYFRLSGPYGLFCTYSALLHCEGSPRQVTLKWMWAGSSKTLLQKHVRARFGLWTKVCQPLSFVRSRVFIFIHPTGKISMFVILYQTSQIIVWKSSFIRCFDALFLKKKSISVALFSSHFQFIGDILN